MIVSVVLRVFDDVLSLLFGMIDERAKPSPGAAPARYYEMRQDEPKQRVPLKAHKAP